MSGSWLLVAAALATSGRYADEHGGCEREVRRLRHADVPALVRAACSERFVDDEAQELIVARGLPALPALLREQIRVQRGGRECHKWPSSLLAEIIAAAHETPAKRRAARAAFEPVLRGLRSGRFDDTLAALSVVEAMSGGSIWERDDVQRSRSHDPPPPTALLESAVEPVMALVRNGQGTVRARALDAMAGLGALCARFVPELEKMLDDPSARPLVAVTLERIGPAAAPAQAALRARLRSETDAQWIQRYGEVLQKIGPDAKLSLPDLWAKLGDDRGLDCARRAERVEQMAKLILAIDGDLRASAAQGGGPALVVALDRAVRASVACQTIATDVMAEMLRKLPGPLTRGALRGQMTDDDLPLRYRMMAAEALSTQGGALPAAEDDLRRILIARRAAQDLEWPSGMGMSPIVARCRGEGGVPGTPSYAAAAPSPRDEVEADTAAETCLETHLCGPGKDRYRRALSICCRYAYGDNQPGWCGDGAR